MKILAIHNNTGSKYYRVVPQLKYLQSKGHEVRLERHDDSHLEQKVDWADIVIFQMVFSKDWIDYAKDKGKKVFFECDDLIHTVPKTHYSYAETRGFKKIKWLWDIYRVLRRCDGFITTTPVLNRVYGWIAKKSLVFPNYSYLEHWLKENPKNTSGKIRLLFAGSVSHNGDLMWIKPILKEILDEYPNVQFIYVGTGGIRTNDLYSKFVYGDDLFEGLPHNRESMLPVPAEVWPYILATLQADIAIAPLEKNYFNSAKSQCKYLEYGLNGLAGVYSRHHYTDVKDGVTGLLADTPEEWKYHLKRLIDNATLRTKIGANAKKDVLENHNINDKLATWEKFIIN